MSGVPENKVICGDCLEVMKPWPSNSVDTVITSPPYWGKLRDYGIEENQIGQEETVKEYIDRLMIIFDEVQRILKPSGVFWLNLGDTYENKNLVGVPSRVALEMRDHHGWILRNDVDWYKSNHMPSSAKDRLANSTENVFLFVKRKRYYFDLNPIRKPYSDLTIKRITQKNVRKQKGGKKTDVLRPDSGGEANYNRPNKMLQSLAKKLTKHDLAVGRIGNFSYSDPLHEREYDSRGRNPGDMWAIPTKPFPGMHFATFPPALITPMVKSSCPTHVCKKCGVPREEIWESTPPEGGYVTTRNVGGRTDGFGTNIGDINQIKANYTFNGYTDCGCGAGYDPGIVLDIFAGSGTALRVARKLGRRFIGIEIVPENCEMARERVKTDKYRPRPEGVKPLTSFKE